MISDSPTVGWKHPKDAVWYCPRHITVGASTGPKPYPAVSLDAARRSQVACFVCGEPLAERPRSMG